MTDEEDWHCPRCGYRGFMVCSVTGPGGSRWWLRCHRCGADTPLSRREP